MDAVGLLRNMIAIPSFSGEEKERADFAAGFLSAEGLSVERIGNNLFTRINCGKENAPTVMLNSHLDTVKPASGYTFDPFNPPHDHQTIYGLGSNDAGGAGVSMIATALHFFKHGGLNFNLLLLLSAEEENSGINGMKLAINHVGDINCAIIGEPTLMKVAIAERGLLVIDGTTTGISGHAARGEGENALYKAIRDIEILRNHRFKKTSPLMGDVRLTVTQITAGTQHNVVPDKCKFVVDIRPTDCYTNEEIWNELQTLTESNLTPRSLTNRSSASPVNHPLIQCAECLGIETYVSPTTSDWMHIGNIPAIKMGPGDSVRSHVRDEFITVNELEKGISGYINFLNNLKLQ